MQRPPHPLSRARAAGRAMAPKKAVEQKKVDRPRKPEEPPHQVDMPVGCPDVAMDSGVNAGLWSKHVDNVNTVTEHQLFQDLVTQAPVGINTVTGQASGGQAVIVNMLKKREYIIGMN